MNKIKALILAPIFLAVGAISAIPELEEKLYDKSNDFRYYCYAYIIIGIIANYYLEQYSPAKKFEKLKKLQWNLFEAITEISTGKLHKAYKFRYNIMVPKRVLTTKLEPIEPNGVETKRTYFADVFEPIWQSKNHIVNKQLKFTVNQGLCGQVFREATGQVAVYSPFIKDHEKFQQEFMFSAHQNGLIGNIQFIASVAILRKDDTVNRRNYKPIAVLNVETSSIKVRELIEDDDLLDDLRLQLQIIGELISEHIKIK